MILGGFGIVIIIREAASLLNVKIQVFEIEQKFWDVPFRERALPLPLYFYRWKYLSLACDQCDQISK